MSVPVLRLPSIRLARHWLLTLIVSMLAVFAASYFYFTAIHAFEVFDTGSCTPLTLDSPPGKCVSSLQELLNDERPYPEIFVDDKFGQQTQQAVMDFQSAHHLAADGVVGDETANAINEFAPQPSILSYAAGFVNSRLTLPAKLCVAILMVFVTIMCLLLRAARAASSSPLRIRCALAALIAANSAATESLIPEAHSWVTRLLCIILAAFTVALVGLLTEMLPSMSALSVLAAPPSRETQPQNTVGYGS